MKGACLGLLTAAVTLLSGCGGTATPAAPQMTLVQSLARPAHAAKGPFLYIASEELSQYELGSSKPLHSVQTDGGYYNNLALDSAGRLLVSRGIGAIGVFDAQTLKLLDNGLGDYITSLAADSRNYVYSANCGGGVDVLSPSAKRLVGVIRKDIYSACIVAFDRAGNLYVANGYHAINIYALEKPGRARFLRSVSQGVTGPDALAFGPTGDLYVCNYPVYSGNGTVTVYPPGASSPKQTLTDDLDYPLALAVDSKGTLYVANQPPTWHGTDGSVTVFIPGSAKALRRIRRGINLPVALTTDSSDNLYVANGYGDSVTVYGSQGATLLRTIRSGVKGPNGLLIGD